MVRYPYWAGVVLFLALSLAPGTSHAVPIVTAADGPVNVVDLASWQFDLSFNPRILQANTVTEGSFMSSFSTTLFSHGVIDKSIGLMRAVVDCEDTDFYDQDDVELKESPSHAGLSRCSEIATDLKADLAAHFTLTARGPPASVVSVIVHDIPAIAKTFHRLQSLRHTPQIVRLDLAPIQSEHEGGPTLGRSETRLAAPPRLWPGGIRALAEAARVTSTPKPQGGSRGRTGGTPWRESGI
jgi:hypothetical protein